MVLHGFIDERLSCVLQLLELDFKGVFIFLGEILELFDLVQLFDLVRYGYVNGFFCLLLE